MKFDEFDQYSENMLMSQYDISEIISHQLMRGEVREDFLIATLESCSDPKPILTKGTISDGTADSGQIDIILCRPYAHIRRLGSQSFVEKTDALCVIEVKGNCTGRDLKDAEAQSKKIQGLAGVSNPQYGVVSYNIELEFKTIMNRFGFILDRSSGTYFDNATLPSEAESNWQPIEYPNIDFFVSLQEDKKVFLRKYQVRPGQFRFLRSYDPPVIKHVFNMLRSLNLSAHYTE